MTHEKYQTNTQVHEYRIYTDKKATRKYTNAMAANMARMYPWPLRDISFTCRLRSAYVPLRSGK